MSGMDGVLNGVKPRSVERGLRAVKSKVGFDSLFVGQAGFVQRLFVCEGAVLRCVGLVRYGARDGCKLVHKGSGWGR